MTLQLVHLDERTRQFMLAEVERDVNNDILYISPRLSPVGQQEYEALLRESIRKYNIGWLEQQLGSNGRINATEQRRTSKGGYTTVRVPVTAALTMAEGEFNRFYVRGLCQRAIEEGITELVVYRAKAVTQPRPESEAKIGSRITPHVLLQDLRTHQGVDNALGLPPGPNSGLSVRLP